MTTYYKRLPTSTVCFRRCCNCCGFCCCYDAAARLLLLCCYAEVTMFLRCGCLPDWIRSRYRAPSKHRAATRKWEHTWHVLYKDEAATLPGEDSSGASRHQVSRRVAGRSPVRSRFAAEPRAKFHEACRCLISRLPPSRHQVSRRVAGRSRICRGVRG